MLCLIVCDTVDGSEIPNNHLAYIKPILNNGIATIPKPQLLSLPDFNVAINVVCVEKPGGDMNLPHRLEVPGWSMNLILFCGGSSAPLLAAVCHRMAKPLLQDARFFGAKTRGIYPSGG